MARRWLRVGRPRRDVCSHERAFYASLENFGAQRIEALAFATQQVLLLARHHTALFVLLLGKYVPLRTLHSPLDEILQQQGAQWDAGFTRSS